MPHPVISCAPNGEDVVLLRALSHLAAPRYLTLGPAEARADDWSQALDAAGWIGSHRVLPDAAEGATDAVVDAVASMDTETQVLWLSQPDLAPAAFSAVEATRPWVVVATASDTSARSLADAASVAARYTGALFDGVSTYYVANEHSDLLPALSYPRCSRDNFVTSTEHRLQARHDALLDELVRWRTTALVGWAAEVRSPHLTGSASSVELARVSDELTALTSTLSWRVTRPLRAVRRRVARPDARS